MNTQGARTVARFPADEWRALYAVLTTAALVDWAAYERARARVAALPDPGPSVDWAGLTELTVVD